MRALCVYLAFTNPDKIRSANPGHGDRTDCDPVRTEPGTCVTTVHANNVIDVIGRFLNMGVEPYNFVSSLNCVLAQRLVPTFMQFVQAAVSPLGRGTN